MSFGQKLTQYRQEAGYTLREFAKKVDYDPSNLSKIERGVNPPPPSGLILKKWAKALNLTENSQGFADFIATGLTTKIQREFKSEKELVKLLPAFCRTVENKQVDPATYKKLMAILKQNT